MKDYGYLTCCIASTAEAINAMTASSKEISYQTMLRNCRRLLYWARDMGYEKRSPGLTLRSDRHVTYHKSEYLGVPCYYLRHSHIEYIWIKGGNDDGIPKHSGQGSGGLCLLPRLRLNDKDRYGTVCP